MWQFIGINIHKIYLLKWDLSIFEQIYLSLFSKQNPIQKSTKWWEWDIISVINNIFIVIGSIIKLNCVNYVTKCVQLLMKQCMYILSKYRVISEFIFIFILIFISCCFLYLSFNRQPFGCSPIWLLCWLSKSDRKHTLTLIICVSHFGACLYYLLIAVCDFWFFATSSSNTFSCGILCAIIINSHI